VALYLGGWSVKRISVVGAVLTSVRLDSSGTVYLVTVAPLEEWRVEPDLTPEPRSLEVAPQPGHILLVIPPGRSTRLTSAIAASSSHG
jgi:hypothetical protein